MKSSKVAYLLWFIGGFGILGLQRLYVKQYGFFALYLFTFGFFLIGSLIDLFILKDVVNKYNNNILEKPTNPNDDETINKKISTSNFSVSDLEVVGESYYQKNIMMATGLTSSENTKRALVATLVLDDYNKHDSNAVMVIINNYQVGFLSKKDAKKYRKQLAKIDAPNKETKCKARAYRLKKNQNWGIFFEYEL